MKLIEMNCPSCGADLKLDADCSKAVCEYCGASVLVDGAQLRDAEREGYEFEKGRQRAIAEAQTAATRKRMTWLWVIGWIFMFPAPITILVTRSKTLKQWQKAVIIALAWGAYLAIGLFGGKKAPDKNAAGTPRASVSAAADTSSDDSSAIETP